MFPADGVIAGLYASTPDPLGVEAAVDVTLITLARSCIPSLRGLEVPFYGRSAVGEKYAAAAVLDALDPAWSHTITTIPAAVLHQQQEPWCGLAAIDERARVAAVARTKGAADLVKRLNDRAGRPAVLHVNVCSAPSSTLTVNRTSGQALQRSLEELVAVDWDGAHLNVEHCDAKTGQSLEKAFLGLDDEIAAVQHLRAGGADCGIVINWGRSAIEYRNAAKVVDHIDRAVDGGVLKAVMFSGASATSDSAYGFWKDLHPSVACDPDIERCVPESLLTPAEMARCMDHARAGRPAVVGFKIHLRPVERYNLEIAVEFNKAMAHILTREVYPTEGR